MSALLGSCELRILSWLLVFITFFGSFQNVKAENSTWQPVFANTSNQTLSLTVNGGSSVSIPLLSLLTEAPPSGVTLTWFYGGVNGGTPPSFLSIDATNPAAPLLVGTTTNSNIGKYQFLLSVQENNNQNIGAFVTVNFTVAAVATWKENPLNLGSIKEETPFSFNLLNYVTVPPGATVTFSVLSGPNTTPLPNWMTFNPNGMLGGTPVRANVGVASGFVFVATTNTGGVSQVPSEITVEFVPRPPSWVSGATLPPVNDNVTSYSQDLSTSTYVNNPDNVPLTFTLIKAPSWISLNGSVLSGVPTIPDDGANSITVQLNASAPNLVFTPVNNTFTLQVNHVRRPPLWTSQSINLGTIPTNKLFSQDLSSYLVNPDGTSQQTFTLTPQATNPGASWASAQSKGMSQVTFTGTPLDTNVGANSWTLTITDSGLSASTIVTAQVVHLPTTWKANPTVLPAATQNQAYSQDLTQFVNDPSGDPLTFTITQIPTGQTSTWASIQGNNFVGTPLLANDGSNSFQIKVTDSFGSTDTATVNVFVTPVYVPPTISQKNLSFTVKARNTLSANLNTPQYATDNNGLSLSFSWANGATIPSFVSLSQTGALTLTPQDKDINTYSLPLVVSDGKSQATAQVAITVLSNPRPPVWKSPIVLKATARVPFADNLNNYAQDLDGMTLTFQMQSPTSSWLSLNPQTGAITGTPSNTDVGKGQFVFTATNGSFTSTGNVEIDVASNPYPPSWTENDIILPSGRAGVSYPVQNLASYVAKSQNAVDTFTFSKASTTPAWVSVGAGGAVSGTPGSGDVGWNSFQVVVTNSYLLTATATVHIQILPPYQAPVWSQNPIILPSGLPSSKVSANLSVYASDPNGLPLTFTLSGNVPPGFTIGGSTGILVGTLGTTPTKTPLTFTVTASNGYLSTPDTIEISIQSILPPVWQTDPIIIPVIAGTPFTQNISTDAKDPQGLALSFGSSTLPSWVTISNQGTLSGTAPSSVVGQKISFTAFASNGTAQSSVGIVLDVGASLLAPIVKNPLVLPDAYINKFYTQNLKGSVSSKNPNAIFSFSAQNLPTWLFVSSQGSLLGTPPTGTPFGLVTFPLTVKDLNNGTEAVTTVEFSVVPNQAPLWNTNPINLGTLDLGKKFTSNLNQYITDPGVSLKFSSQNGPLWLATLPDGSLVGTPNVLGEFTVTFYANDGVNQIPVQAYGKVVNSSIGPIINAQNLVFTLKVNTTLAVQLNDPKYVVDNASSSFTFGITPAVAWMGLNTFGLLTLSPNKVGDYTFTLKVTDNLGNSNSAPLIVHVVPNGIQGPTWKETTLYFETQLGQPFSQNLSNYVQNPSKSTLSFFIVSGDGSWVSLGDATGILDGTPNQVQLYTFVIGVKDPVGNQSTVIVKINVIQSKPVVDTFVVDSFSQKASIEPIWVVDSSWRWLNNNRLMVELKNNINVYFQALTQANIDFNGVYLSSDTGNFHGQPLVDPKTKDEFISSTVNSPGDMFIRILEYYRSQICYPSPLWSLFMFYEQLKGFGFFQKNYFMPQIPTDVLVVTRQKDFYQRLSQNTQSASWGPTEYANFFKDTNAQYQKAFYFSAIAPQCTGAIDPFTEHRLPRQDWENIAIEKRDGVFADGSVSPYTTLAQDTGGKFYPFDCKSNMSTILEDYAAQTIFHAKLNANSVQTLSKKPINPKGIQVALAGKIIPGNTGGKNDVWSYNASTNQITFHWYLLPPSLIKSGDVVTITYQAS